MTQPIDIMTSARAREDERARAEGRAQGKAHAFAILRHRNAAGNQELVSALFDRPDINTATALALLDAGADEIALERRHPKPRPAPVMNGRTAAASQPPRFPSLPPRARARPWG